MAKRYIFFPLALCLRIFVSVNRVVRLQFYNTFRLYFVHFHINSKKVVLLHFPSPLIVVVKERDTAIWMSCSMKTWEKDKIKGGSPKRNLRKHHTTDALRSFVMGMGRLLP